MNQETFYIPSEMEYFFRDNNVLLVSANPVGWAIIDRESAEIVQALPKECLLSKQDILEELKKQKYEDADLEDIIEFLRNLKDSYVITDQKMTGEQTDRPLKIGGVFIETTSQCNLRCKHCYLSAADSLENELSTDEIISIVHQLEPPAVVALSGGEPLMRNDIIPLLQQFAQEGYRCSLLTNATLITPSIAVQIKEAKRATVQVSLESFDKNVHESIRGKNTFEQTMEGIRNLMGAGCRLRLSFTPTKLNIDTFEDYVTQARALGIRAIHVCTYTPQGRGNKNQDSLRLDEHQLFEFQILLKKLSKKVQILGDLPSMLDLNRVGYSWDSCPLAGNIHIISDGTIYPCEICCDEYFALGNIRKMTLQEALESPIMCKMHQNSRERINIIPECKECIWRHMCGGGCMVLSYLDTKEINHVDYYCNLRKYWFERLHWDNH